MANYLSLRTIVKNGWTIANRREITSSIGKNRFNELSTMARKNGFGGDRVEFVNAKKFLQHDTIKTTEETLKLNFTEIIKVIKLKIDDFKKTLLLKDNNKMSIQSGIYSIDEINDALISMHTVYDTKQIVLARLQSLIAGFIKISSSKLKKDTTIKKLLNDISDEIIVTPKNKQLIIVTGGAASGKSTYIDNLMSNNQLLLADADVIKRNLPGYNEFGSSFVHTLSAQINRAKLSEAINAGCNIVYPTTGSKSVIEIIEKAKNNGYENIKVVFCDAPTDIRAKRVVERFASDGRFVDPYYVLQQTNNYKDLIEICRKFNTNIEKVSSIQ